MTVDLALSTLLLLVGTLVHDGVLLLLLLLWLTRRRTEVEPTVRYLCECRHSLAFHEPPFDRCLEATLHEGLAETFACRCQRYVGPRPPIEVDPDEVLRQLQRVDRYPV